MLYFKYGFYVNDVKSAIIIAKEYGEGLRNSLLK